MGSTSSHWNGDWRRRVRERVRALGCTSVTEFLSRFPGEPYLKTAERLGDGTAALQLEWIHFAEAASERDKRRAAMDSLVRDLHAYLPSGWATGTNADFNTARVFATWATRTGQQVPGTELKAKAVWDALKQMKPHTGWLPSDSTDSLLSRAFERGWPPSQEASTSGHARQRPT